MKQKIVKDPMYGYVSIDADIFEQIIDTKYFQRLRRIEQTSMRCLYPTARHDRFVHSMGVYYLAKLAMDSLEKNLNNGDSYGIEQKLMQVLPEETRNSIRFTFEMAALLHDVGHSPFSHTLERYFRVKYYRELNEIKHKDIIDDLLYQMKQVYTEEKRTEEEFKLLESACKEAKAAPHEIASCIVILRCFKETLLELAESRKLKFDFDLMVRCILGALYSTERYSQGQEDEEQRKREFDYKNCIIKLLNSSIDVDKLDYICRDSELSGFNNIKIDTTRLLGSLILAKYKGSNGVEAYCLAFKKSALSVVENVITSRNSLYTWIYSHHKVKYETFLIETAIQLIAAKEKESAENEQEKNLYISDILSVDSIINNLICDDTVWALFMKYRTEIPEINELITRNEQKKAVWKSFAEFQVLFNNTKSISAIGSFSTEQMERFFNRDETDSEYRRELKEFQEHLNKFKLDTSEEDIKFELVVNKTKLAKIEHNSILIQINGKLYGFDTIFKEINKDSHIPLFFYLYCSKKTKKELEDKNKTQDLIAHIKKYKRFQLEPHDALR